VTRPGTNPAAAAGSVVVVGGGTVVVVAGIVVLAWVDAEEVLEVLVDGWVALTFAAAGGLVAAALRDDVGVEEVDVFAMTAAPTPNTTSTTHRMSGTDRADFRVAPPARAMCQLSPLRGRGIPSPPLFARLSRKNSVFGPEANPD
jgi:hypothetical protein